MKAVDAARQPANFRFEGFRRRKRTAWTPPDHLGSAMLGGANSVDLSAGFDLGFHFHLASFRRNGMSSGSLLVAQGPELPSV